MFVSSIDYSGSSICSLNELNASTVCPTSSQFVFHDHTDDLKCGKTESAKFSIMVTCGRKLIDQEATVLLIE